MKGQILGYNKHSQTGVIVGEDRQRYNFDVSDWLSIDEPVAGVFVDFVAQDTEAKEICISHNEKQSNIDENKVMLKHNMTIEGKVLGYDKYTQTGVITTAHRQRYNFNISDWHTLSEPVVGMLVDFVEHGTEAKEIYESVQNSKFNDESAKSNMSLEGRILGYDKHTLNGVIGTSNDKRYDFHLRDVKVNEELYAGMLVEFIAQGKYAKEIYVTSRVTHSVRTRKTPKRNIAALLACFLGGFGAHKFYLGYTKEGAIMLISATLGSILIVPALIVLFIAIIEVFCYLLPSEKEFEAKYVHGYRGWF